MEWNWFFSTIAQSTAAITGIFAAFIITKIVGSQAEYRKKCARIRELIAIAEKFQDKLKNQYFTWYNERTDFSAMKQVRELIWGDNPIRSAEEYYDEAEFSVYSESSETICKIEAILEEINAAGNQDRSTRTHEFNTLPTSTDSMQFQLDFTAKLRDNLRKERESIEEISLEVRHHTRTVEIFLKEIIGNPESSQLIKWAILGVLILFYTGVILPIAFLPTLSSSICETNVEDYSAWISPLKPIILIMVSVVFTVIMFVFLKVNRELCYNQDTVSQLRHITDFSNYSDYFKRQKMNKIAFAKRRNRNKRYEVREENT